MNPLPLLAVQAEGVAASTPPKLVKSAREFEAILIESWLEKMNHSFVGDSESSDAAHDTVSSMGSQAIATALADRGGIGIAAMLISRLQKQDMTTNKPAVQSDRTKVQAEVSRSMQGEAKKYGPEH